MKIGITVHSFARGFALVLFGALLAACGGQQEPAKKAVETAEASIAAIREDAARFFPDDLKDLETSLAAMKDNYAKGKYPSVLTASRSLNTRIAQVANAIAGEKTENQAMTEQLTVQWNTLSEELPAIVESVTARVASLEKSGKLPKDVDEATFSRVKADAAIMAQSWQQAQGAFSNGNMQEAVDMATTAKEKAGTVMMILGMT
jgi:hypothetical protein